MELHRYTIFIPFLLHFLHPFPHLSLSLSLSLPFSFILSPNIPILRSQILKIQMGFQNFFSILLPISLFLQFHLSHSQNPLICHSNDSKAFQDFHRSISSQIDGLHTNCSTNCCSCTGLTCDSFGRVVKIELGGRKLVGELPNSIARLERLRVLNLSSNFLSGFIPLALFQLPYLEVLDLSFNRFFGNFSTGTIDLPSLRILNVSRNSFSGVLPFGVCVNSSRIEVLNLGFNDFVGMFPFQLGECVSLKRLHLESNIISGGIPDEVSELRKLTHLCVQNNKLSGSLNSVVGNLTSLVRLDLSSNEFFGEIPDVFYNSVNLSYFSAESNRFNGRIPKSLSNSASMTVLNLRNNSIGGTLDLNCSVMTSLVSLDLGSNRFQGSIPSNLPSCTQLRSINLARNKLGGQIPGSFRNFQSLSYLSLTNTSIVNVSSALNVLQHCQNLSTVVLTFNFHGEVLEDNPNLHFKSLQVFIIANCRLKGMIPQWLRGSNKLQFLDLSWNHLGGNIPSWFGEFQFVFYLDLSNNSFIGGIPKEITEMRSYIDRNFLLDGPASPDFSLFVKRNGTGWQYNQVRKFPPTLDLSLNNLSGPIWPEFGNLKEILVLDLKYNRLSGSIPSNLSGMVSLETLDLSHNNLSGIIPPSLQKLNFLSKFSVAYNQLHGAILKGGQFHTFGNSSFEGNNFCVQDDLCASIDRDPLIVSRKSRTVMGSLIGVILGIIFGVIFLATLVVVFVLRAPQGRVRDPENEVSNIGKNDLKEVKAGLVVLFQNNNNGSLSLEDILKSTNDFDQENIIGCGGFGLVYKATLLDGRKVAVKRLSGDCGQMDREFRAEIETLSRAQHPNLVLLQGYCMYKNDRLLIYSYMENGSLDYWLHEKPVGPSCLDWDTRLQIAQGAARGLAYLHQSCEPHILHRDIKSSNILLDKNFKAHLADFGLARLILPYDTHITTDLVGTLGYIPPEYGQSSVATYNGDVYSFGVVLLELLTGKRPIDMCRPKGFRDLISWVFQMRKDGKVSEVFDPLVYDKKNETAMVEVLDIACLCLCMVPKERPSTQQLVSWLDKVG
ncbi:phytosulfokine receptor 1-like [Benincasa hispida]|uniref:phytosulfokine receptor 1-like n=1 Tax=Benincasa hispida TaxID=102211 RepID=UPI0018FF5FA8|nr:phytosulfokine receptor 1-like [Benincasa hispida]